MTTQMALVLNVGVWELFKTKVKACNCDKKEVIIQIEASLFRQTETTFPEEHDKA